MRLPHGRFASLLPFRLGRPSRLSGVVRKPRTSNFAELLILLHGHYHKRGPMRPRDDAAKTLRNLGSCGSIFPYFAFPRHFGPTMPNALQRLIRLPNFSDAKNARF